MKEELIRKIPMFASLPEGEIRILAESLYQCDYPAGTLLVEEGQNANRFYILLEGEVEIIKALGTTDERLLAVRQAGTFIGEMGLLSDAGQHTATVRAHNPITLLEMTRDDFDELLHRQPSLGYEMVRTISRRLNEAENLTIRDLRRKNRELTQAYEELAAAQAQIIEKERMERELEVARDIQSSILPRVLPEFSGFDFGALMEPMSAVGGDFFDFLNLGDGRLGIAVGDVSDHGVPAALFMAMTVTLLRAEAGRGSSPRDVLLRVNQQLLDLNETGMFVTILYGELDLNSNRFSYVRAGHEMPLVYLPSGDFLDLPQGQGQLMGIIDGPSLDEQQIDLTPGSTLVLYTDGVHEASDLRGVLFGLDRLRQSVAESPPSRAQKLCEHVMDRVRLYRGSDAQQDDITLVGIVLDQKSPN